MPPSGCNPPLLHQETRRSGWHCNGDDNFVAPSPTPPRDSLADQRGRITDIAGSAAPGDAARHERVDLQALAREAAEAVQPRAQERGCTLALALDAHAAVNGERQKLLSLMINLLDNAMRYGPEGGRVGVTLRREGSFTTLAVTDEGPGIPAGLRGRVFESYYRMPGSNGPGSGLGLAIAREVAEAHGARIAVEDGPGGRGTRVVVRFEAV